MDTTSTPGPIILFGSGETSPSGRKVYESVFNGLPARPRVALLETPAGFELNSAQVIGRVGEYLAHRLQNYKPRLATVAARQRGTLYSPDDPEIVAPLYEADLIFMGPGSPTYAVRQLTGSLAWEALRARHRLGAALVLASAAVVSISARALPVYEIYKVGEELHWKPGLDLFGAYGLSLVFVPHWNNTDGGAELDTSRCFMGRPRFVRLVEQLPAGMTVVGVDEQTALIVDPLQGSCRVQGLGGVTLIHTGGEHPGAESSEALQEAGLVEVTRHLGAHVHRYESGGAFELHKLGAFDPPQGGAGLQAEVWERAQQVQARLEQEVEAEQPAPPAEVLALVAERQAARERKDWAASDALRDRIGALGWVVQDTPQGPQVASKDEA